MVKSATFLRKEASFSKKSCFLHAHILTDRRTRLQNYSKVF